MTQRTISSLSLELKEENIREVVFIDGKEYFVDRGVVYAGTDVLSGFAAWEPLWLARASVFAKRSPFFALPGTDIKKLREAIQSLEIAQKNLSSIQKTPQEATAVMSLYPIAFLKALADVEEARQQFIAYPNSEHERVYEQATADTFETKVKDTKNFTREFAALNDAFPRRFAGFGGSISVDTMKATLGLFQKDIVVNKAAFNQYVACQRNIFISCKKIPPTPIPSIPSGGVLVVSEQAQDILKLWGEVHQKNTQGTPLVTVSRSRCLNSLKSPYTFAFQNVKNGSATFTSTVYVGDLFFVPTTIPDMPFLQYQKETTDMDYNVYSPFKYYICAELGEDMGQIFAIRAIADFATAHPTIAPNSRTVLLRDPLQVDETSALTYLAEALQVSSLDAQTQRMLSDLALMVTRKTGGLEDLLHDIALVSSVDAQHYSEGAPVSISARVLFLAYSAFPSLFRIGSTDESILAQLRVSNSQDVEGLLKYAEDYKTLSARVSQEKILKDMRSYLRIGRRL